MACRREKLLCRGAGRKSESPAWIILFIESGTVKPWCDPEEKKEGIHMKTIRNQTFDEERALYGSQGICLQHCAFDGPADGESALKESSQITADHCFFNLRYPFWHDSRLTIRDSEMTSLCRAALWYSQQIEITGTKLYGIKALRECRDITMKNCRIQSPEFGWFTKNITMDCCQAESEYFMLQAQNLKFSQVEFQGKYSFQYIRNGVFENCVFDTKDAFWHAENVTVKNSVVKGEYLGWYSHGLTLENCKIIGTQPLCYCTDLKLIRCEMEKADLCFEKSQVEASITTPVTSIKNPLSGRIVLPAAEEIILDDPQAKGQIILQNGKDKSCA